MRAAYHSEQCFLSNLLAVSTRINSSIDSQRIIQLLTICLSIFRVQGYEQALVRSVLEFWKASGQRRVPMFRPLLHAFAVYTWFDLGLEITLDSLMQRKARASENNIG